jgi:hypothetical protein
MVMNASENAMGNKSIPDTSLVKPRKGKFGAELAYA